MHMGVLEGVIETPAGALRVYSVHQSSADSKERQRQAEFLIELVKNSPQEGGAWTGSVSEYVGRDWSVGKPQPLMPESAVMLGDFNMEPGSPEHTILVNALTAQCNRLFIDAWEKMNQHKSVSTWYQNPGRPGPDGGQRLDYCFVTPDIAGSVETSWIDEQADGSDHQPVWLELSEKVNQNT